MKNEKKNKKQKKKNKIRTQNTQEFKSSFILNRNKKETNPENSITITQTQKKKITNKNMILT